MKVICEKGIKGFFEEGKTYTLSENGSVMTDKTSMASYQRMGQTNRFVCEFGGDVAIFSKKDHEILSMSGRIDMRAIIFFPR